MAEAPQGTEPQRCASVLSLGDHGRDGDDVVGVGRVPDAKEQAESEDGQQRHDHDSSGVNGEGAVALGICEGDAVLRLGAFVTLGSGDGKATKLAVV
jgi:hypothetical protein